MGSLPVLQSFRFIKTEVADFESYAGCCQLSDIDSFMTEHGHEELSRRSFATRPAVGTDYDIVYERRAYAPSDNAARPSARFFEQLFGGFARRIALIRLG